MDQGNTRILFIESDPLSVQDMIGKLSGYEVDLYSCTDPQQAVEQIRAVQPGLILLRIELPKVSGYSICNKLKREAEFRSLPLVIISSNASSDTFEQHKRLRTRAEAYLQKPFETAALLQAIEPLIQLRPLGQVAPSPVADGLDVDLEGIELRLDTLDPDLAQLQQSGTPGGLVDIGQLLDGPPPTLSEEEELERVLGQVLDGGLTPLPPDLLDEESPTQVRHVAQLTQPPAIEGQTLPESQAISAEVLGLLEEVELGYALPLKDELDLEAYQQPEVHQPPPLEEVDLASLDLGEDEFASPYPELPTADAPLADDEAAGPFEEYEELPSSDDGFGSADYQVLENEELELPADLRLERLDGPELPAAPDEPAAGPALATAKSAPQLTEAELAGLAEQLDQALQQDPPELAGEAVFPEQTVPQEQSEEWEDWPTPESADRPAGADGLELADEWEDWPAATEVPAFEGAKAPPEQGPPELPLEESSPGELQLGELEAYDLPGMAELGHFDEFAPPPAEEGTEPLAAASDSEFEHSAPFELPDSLLAAPPDEPTPVPQQAQSAAEGFDLHIEEYGAEELEELELDDSELEESEVKTAAAPAALPPPPPPPPPPTPGYASPARTSGVPIQAPVFGGLATVRQNKPGRVRPALPILPAVDEHTTASSLLPWMEQVLARLEDVEAERDLTQIELESVTGRANAMERERATYTIRSGELLRKLEAATHDAEQAQARQQELEHQLAAYQLDENEVVVKLRELEEASEEATGQLLELKRRLEQVQAEADELRSQAQAAATLEASTAHAAEEHAEVRRQLEAALQDVAQVRQQLDEEQAARVRAEAEQASLQQTRAELGPELEQARLELASVKEQHEAELLQRDIELEALRQELEQRSAEANHLMTEGEQVRAQQAELREQLEVMLDEAARMEATWTTRLQELEQQQAVQLAQQQAEYEQQATAREQAVKLKLVALRAELADATRLREQDMAEQLAQLRQQQQAELSKLAEHAQGREAELQEQLAVLEAQLRQRTELEAEWQKQQAEAAGREALLQTQLDELQAELTTAMQARELLAEQQRQLVAERDEQRQDSEEQERLIDELQARVARATELHQQALEAATTHSEELTRSQQRIVELEEETETLSRRLSQEQAALRQQLAAAEVQAAALVAAQLLGGELKSHTADLTNQLVVGGQELEQTREELRQAREQAQQQAAALVQAEAQLQDAARRTSELEQQLRTVEEQWNHAREQLAAAESQSTAALQRSSADATRAQQEFELQLGRRTAEVEQLRREQTALREELTAQTHIRSEQGAQFERERKEWQEQLATLEAELAQQRLWQAQLRQAQEEQDTAVQAELQRLVVERDALATEVERLTDQLRQTAETQLAQEEQATAQLTDLREQLTKLQRSSAELAARNTKNEANLYRVVQKLRAEEAMRERVASALRKVLTWLVEQPSAPPVAAAGRTMTPQAPPLTPSAMSSAGATTVRTLSQELRAVDAQPGEDSPDSQVAGLEADELPPDHSR